MTMKYAAQMAISGSIDPSCFPFASARAEVSRRYRRAMPGDADIAKTAALIADPGRARMLFALGDGRALPASVLAAEAEVAPSTASGHLSQLVDAGLLVAERQGRHRYFRVAGPQVVRVLEALAQISPPRPVKSLRQGTRAQQIRDARLCYDHVAGRLGVGVMGRLLELGALDGGDGLHHPEHGGRDRLSARGADVDYVVTDDGEALLRRLGVDLDALRRGRRPVVRYCLDWSEQRHHLAGSLGAAVAGRFLELDWVRRAPRSRALTVTGDGREGLRDALGLTLA
jgi:DNA-binding transcriptional ArsR family regulator